MYASSRSAVRSDGEAGHPRTKAESGAPAVEWEARSACVPGAHLAARHRCDIPARSRPRPRRTPILG